MKSEEIFYKPPMIDVIEVEVESGFAVSGYGSDSDDSEFGSYNYQEYEKDLYNTCMH